jgi:hypothetical protein
MGGMSDVSNMRRNKHDLGYNIVCVLEIDHTRKLLKYLSTDQLDNSIFYISPGIVFRPICLLFLTNILSEIPRNTLKI